MLLQKLLERWQIFISTPDESLSKMHFGNDAFISSENFAEKSKTVHLITFKKFSSQAYFFQSDNGLMCFFTGAANSFKSIYILQDM